MAQGDMFLKIDGTRQGSIKGEARDAGHKDEIDVLGWTWGMEGNMVHGQATAKTAVRELKISKRVDKATTGLMAALRSNEVIKKAVLTVRKAGGIDPVEYYTITLEKGRITSLIQQSGDSADPAALHEEVGIAFSKVAVEYKPQGDDGQFRGATSFEMDIFEGQ
ncbi:MAG: type VI secretion system tube protein Hcp [Pseudomonadota bacterium]|nr:type VI secretion system tube protein Hcp [Pseudomonadota bacterium]